MGIRRIGSTALLSVAVVAVPAQDPPPADEPPTVTISGPTQLRDGPSEPCSDGLVAGSGVVRLLQQDPDGAPDGTPPPEIGYVVGGTAAPGVDYELDPPSPTSSDSIALDMLPGPDPAGSTATLTITLQPGAGYELGEPSTLEIELLHLDRRCEAPTFADVPTNTAQTIAVGAVPAPLQLVDPVNGVAHAALIDGQLPPGVGLSTDGTFTGAARTAGTYVATVGSCRPVFAPPPGFCTRQALTITVVGASLAEREPPCAVRAIGARAGGPGTFDASGGGLVFLGGTGTSAASMPFLYRTASGRLESLPDLVGAASPVQGSKAIDISSDGRTVVYDLPWVAVGQGHATDVAAYDVASGTAVVAFRVEGLLTSLLLSPDGSRAYVQTLGSSAGPGLMAADLRTGAVTPLTSTFVLDLVDVSGDGAWLLGHSTTGPILIDTSTGSTTPLAVAPGGDDEALGFGGSSSSVLVLRRSAGPDEIQHRDLADGTAVPVPTPTGLLDAVAGRAGRAIATTATSDTQGLNADGGVELFVQPAGGSIVQVTETSGGGGPEALAVTDDGRTIAFVAAGSLDAAGRGTLATSSSSSAVYVARCGTTALARTG